MPITVLENVVSNAERRGLQAGDTAIVPRVADIYAALPSITGKIELEYEGELKGGEIVARELVRLAVAKTFTRFFDEVNLKQVVQWFDMGGTLKVDDDTPATELLRQLEGIQGLMEKTSRLGLGAQESDALRASAGEFVLEGLYAHRRISRNAERGFAREDRKAAPPDDAPERKPRRQFN